jgi:hypothetical protein
MFHKTHNLINDASIDSHVIGIIITFPIIGEEEQPVIGTFEKCKKCDTQKNGYGKFCSNCGGEFHTVTESVKDWGKVRTQQVPLPDVRAEMKELGIKNHLPMDLDNLEDLEEEWKFVYIEYKCLGHRSSYGPFLDELDLEKIQKDLEEAKVKFKDIIEKYNGCVVFGVAGQFTDW